MPTEFDVCLLGAGQAAMPLARKLDAAGKSIALVERSLLGGSCVNFGCTPTKAVIAAAEAVKRARDAVDLGVHIGSIEPDFAKVIGRAMAIVRNFRSHIEKDCRSLKNMTMHHGHGRFAGRVGDRIRVQVEGGETLLAKQVVIDTGTKSILPKIPGIESAACRTAENWVEMTERPGRIIFLGAGYIGLELAQFFRRMGSEVEIVDHGAQVIGHEDEEIANEMQRLLTREGIRFRMNADVERVSRTGEEVSIEFKGGDCTTTDCLFLATGRAPNTRDIGLETIEIEADKKGVIPVDEHLQTTAKNVFAVGDVRGGPMFTHTAWDDHRIVADQLLGDGKRSTKGRVIPYGVFTDPELGRVGMTEREARAAGKSVRVVNTPMSQNSKAIESGQTDGCVKLVIDTQTDRLLGAAVLATGGAELVGSFITLMNADAPLSKMRDAIYIHPTLTQALQTAALAK